MMLYWKCKKGVLEVLTKAIQYQPGRALPRNPEVGSVAKAVVFGLQWIRIYQAFPYGRPAVWFPYGWKERP
jgi:hypothetical protein